MTIEILMPKLGIYMEKGKIARWLKAEEEPVEKGEPVLVVETDKVNFEVEAPASGTVKRILVKEGEEAAVNSVVALIEEEGEERTAIEPERPVRAAAEKQEMASPPKDQAEEVPFVKATPLARRIAKDHGIDLRTVKGSGPGGRIIQEDILSASSKPKEAEGLPSEKPAPEKRGRSVPLTRMREIIAERLSKSFRDVPHVFFSAEVNASQLILMRETLNREIEKEGGIRLSYSDILVKAASMILKKYPFFNATLEGKEIVLLPDINIGLAVALEDGLIVPVLRKVDRMELSEIARSRSDLVQRARQKKLVLDDLQGGTFTISNLGEYEVDSFTSIINPPEVGILSVARIKKRAIVENDAVEIRPIMNIGLSADHRVVDGAAAASFLQDLKRLLENPYLFVR